MKLPRLWPTALSLLCSLALAQAPASPGTTAQGPAPAAVAGLAALPGGTRLVCAGTSLWTLSTSAAPRRLPLPEDCQGLRVSPSGKVVLVSGRASVTVWRLDAEQQSDGQLWRRVALPEPARRVAFLNDSTLLLAGARGLEQLDLNTQARTLLRPGAVTGLATAPDGRRAVMGDGSRVQLVNVADGAVLSGVRCEVACPLQDVQFSRDQRGAVVQAGPVLYALREGHPATAVLRGAEGAMGFPLPDGGVWVLTAGRLERRDAQTGRREGVLRPEGVSGPAAWTPEGGLLYVAGRELVELDKTGQEVGRTALP